jgi:plasmid stabilization system protein ParE
VNRPVHWSSGAAAQLAAIARYVGATSPLYAERLIDRLLARTAQLASFPELGRAVPEGNAEDIRELVEGSYRIIYLLQASRVDVLAVVHVRQDIHWPE